MEMVYILYREFHFENDESELPFKSFSIESVCKTEEDAWNELGTYLSFVDGTLEIKRKQVIREDGADIFVTTPVGLIAVYNFYIEPHRVN